MGASPYTLRAPSCLGVLVARKQFFRILLGINPRLSFREQEEQFYSHRLPRIVE